MRSIICLTVAFVLSLAPTAARSLILRLPDTQVNVTFSPDGGTTQKLVEAIKTCQNGERLLVAAYSFTSKPIVQALIEAKRAGVDVQILVDKGQERNRYSGWKACVQAGIPVYFDVIHSIQHNKFMVFGDRGVTFGSFNFTVNAEKNNAENNLVVWSPSLARVYAENWTALVLKARIAK